MNELDHDAEMANVTGAEETPHVPNETPALTETSSNTGERYSRRDLATLALRLENELEGMATIPALGGAFALLGKAEADLDEIRGAVVAFLTTRA